MRSCFGRRCRASKGCREPHDAIDGGSAIWWGKRVCREVVDASSAETDEQSLDGYCVRQAQILASPQGIMLNRLLSTMGCEMGRAFAGMKLGETPRISSCTSTSLVTPISAAPNSHALANASISLAPMRGDVELTSGPSATDMEVATAAALLVPSVLVPLLALDEIDAGWTCRICFRVSSRFVSP